MKIIGSKTSIVKSEDPRIDSVNRRGHELHNKIDQLDLDFRTFVDTVKYNLKDIEKAAFEPLEQLRDLDKAYGELFQQLADINEEMGNLADDLADIDRDLASQANIVGRLIEELRKMEVSLPPPVDNRLIWLAISLQFVLGMAYAVFVV